MTKPTVVSLYTGAGGLDYGFEAAGYRTVVAVEMDGDCCATLRANRGWQVLEGDIASFSSEKILGSADLRKGEVDVLIGGPPCQPFSKSGYWARGDAGRLRDPRARTLDEYMRCVRDLLPKAFLLENVHGISYSGKEEGFQLLQRLTDEINEQAGTSYEPRWQVLNAVDYGVPQRRVRFFLVAQRDGKLFEFPNPTHGAAERDALFSTGLRPFATAWDAIGGFEPPCDEDLRPRGRWAELLPSIPEGENYLWHTDRGGGRSLFGWRRRFWSFLLKLAKDRPSWTIQAQPGPAVGPFHWTSRRLSIEEMARLQTFPRNLRYVGTRSSVQRQIGNAVPSLMAEILAREIRRQFLGGRRAPAKLAVAPRQPVPPSEPVAPVPKKFLALEGEHSEHPGTGKGHGARRRSREVDTTLWE